MRYEVIVVVIGCMFSAGKRFLIISIIMVKI